MKRYSLIFLLLVLSAPQSFADGPLRIAFLTDSHYGKAKYTESMLQCIEDINVQDSLDFVLVGGDVTNGGSDLQIKAAKDYLDRLDIPYWVVSGHHDSKWSESGCNTFVKTFGYEQFEFEAGGYRFIGCNSGPDMRTSDALIPRSSMNWLMSLQPGKPLIFINHFPMNAGILNCHEVRRELLRLDCRFAVAGHVHKNSKRDYDGLPFITCRPVIRKGVVGYNILTIRDGVVRVSQRLLGDGGFKTHTPWYEKELCHVEDTVRYDADGLPENYKHLTYRVNDEYPQVKVVWSRTEDANIGSGFARNGEVCWYATAAGKVVSMSVSDGKPIWEKMLPGKVYATPVVKNDILVVPCTDGVIYAFNAKTGKEKWRYEVGKAVVASPTIYGKNIYVGGSDKTFRALRLRDGKLVWSRSGIHGYCDGAPYVDKSQVVFNTWGERVYSLDTKTGDLQWEWIRKGSELRSPGASTPIKSGDRVFIVCADRRTYCLNAHTGEVLFFADGGRESFAISDDLQTIYVKTMFGKAFALPAQIPLSEVNGTLSPDSPSKKWWKPDVPVMDFEKALWYVESGMGNDISSSPLAICGNTLLLPSDKGNLHAMDCTTGECLWIHKIGIGLVNPVTSWIEGDRMYILASTMDGKIELMEITE